MSSFLATGPVDATLARANFVPTKIVEQKLLSETKHAFECFAHQKFSQELQRFLINYVISVSSYQAIYK